ncbi:DUF6931 family protein [Planctomycetes bacterium Pan216]|uniref:DUF6931 family protein n=1 Tax=Kolteria novifilia TaxID=2527975 RepID=UPI0011A43DEA
MKVLNIPFQFAGGGTTRAVDLWDPPGTTTGDALRLLTEEITAADYLRALVAYELYYDALRFVAFGLEKRQAVYWGCLCYGSLFGPRLLPDEEARALDAAMAWVRDPSESHRQRAGRAALAAGMSTPAGCLAKAAFWSGGSIAPEGMPTVEASEYLVPKAVAGAVVLTVALADYHRLDAHCRVLLGLGMQVAQGARRWLEPETASAPEPSMSHAPADEMEETKDSHDEETLILTRDEVESPPPTAQSVNS